jgi:flagellin
MALSILNNIPSLAAQNQLAITGSSLQKTLFRLSSGSRINSGADDAAGLAIADGLHANMTALTQSARNANDGVGMLQVADGALAQVTTLLNRAVTLASESATGTVSDSQRGSLNTEYQAIMAEVDRIGASTTYNGTNVFSGGTVSVYLAADGSSGTNSKIDVNSQALSAAALGLTAGTINSNTPAVAGSGSLSIMGLPSDGDQVTVGAKTYTFRTALSSGPTVANEILIGGSAAQTATHLAEAVNGGSNIGTDYSTGTTANATASASAAGTVVNISALTAGAAGNAIVLTASSTEVSASGSGTLAGGADATTGTTAVTNTLSTASDAQLTLSMVNSAIQNVAGMRGTLGAGINRLQSAVNVINNQVQNLTAAEDGIRSADIAAEVANLTKYSILNQTGISALAQANQMQQSVLSLLK